MLTPYLPISSAVSIEISVNFCFICLSHKKNKTIWFDAYLRLATLSTACTTIPIWLISVKLTLTIVNLNLIVVAVLLNVFTVMENVFPTRTDTGTGLGEDNGGFPWSLAEMKIFRASNDVVGKSLLVEISPLLKVHGKVMVSEKIYVSLTILLGWDSSGKIIPSHDWFP